MTPKLPPVRVTRRDRRTYRPELVLAPGPAQLGQPGGGTYAELYGCPWALALHKTGPQLYQLSAGAWVPRSDLDALAPLTVGLVRHVALAFDQAARPVLAWESGGMVSVRQWSPDLAQYVTRGPWAGCDPCLTNDVTAHGQPGLSDVLLLHLSANRAQLCARVQVEQYAQSRVLGAAPADAVLDQVLTLPLAWQAHGGAGRELLAWRSDLYPAHVLTLAAAQLSGLVGGALQNMIITLQLGDTAAAQLSGLSGGIWSPVTITASGTDTAAAQLGALTGGTYTPLTVTVSGTDTAAAQLGALTGGTWQLIVISISGPVEAVAASVTGLSGGSLNV